MQQVISTAWLSVLATALALSLGLPETALADETRGNDESNSDKSSEQGLQVMGPVGDHMFAVGFESSTLFWDTPYGNRKFELLFGGTLRYRKFAPMYLSATVDYARRAPVAGNLVATNAHTGGLVGVGVEAWLHNYHVFGEVRGGALFRSIRLGDGDGADYTATRVRPTAGLHYGFGFAFFQKFVVNITGGGRIYAPGRMDLHVGVQTDWLFTGF